MSEKLFSMHFGQNDDDTIGVSTKFHKKIAGAELAAALKIAIRGMLQTVTKLIDGDDAKAVEFVFADEEAITK